MEVLWSSETPVNYQTTTHYITEDRTLCGHYCRNLKSKIINYVTKYSWVIKQFRTESGLCSKLMCCSTGKVKELNGCTTAMINAMHKYYTEKYLALLFIRSPYLPHVLCLCLCKRTSYERKLPTVIKIHTSSVRKMRTPILR
jgi:hypothetical protein